MWGSVAQPLSGKRGATVVTMRKAVIALVVAAGLFFGALASADTTIISDANDSSGFLDIEKAGATHGRGGKLKHSVIMYSTWRSRDLRCASVDLFFPDQRRSLSIDWRDGHLRARMSEETGPGDARTVGHPRVWRRDRRTVVTSFRRSLLGGSPGTYRWRAVAGSPVDPCPAPDYVIDVDKAPDRWNKTHSI